jgi:hypothetical protein
MVISLKNQQKLVGQKLPPPPPLLSPNEELLRLRLTRIMDDGTQTLGIMDVLDTDEQSVLYSLATVELPYLDNQNKISCIPTDMYRVKSYSSWKYGRCFWLIGNSKGEYKYNRIEGNGYTRSTILIHASAKATKDLQGCIGPGLKFNDQNFQIGKQKGTGMFYMTPSREQSQQALNKLLNTLYSIGSFKMQIINDYEILLQNAFNVRVRKKAEQYGLLPNPYIAPKQ